MDIPEPSRMLGSGMKYNDLRDDVAGNYKKDAVQFLLVAREYSKWI